MESNDGANVNSDKLSDEKEINNNSFSDFHEEKNDKIFTNCPREFFKDNKYLAIKIPAKIENPNKVIELLGGFKKINKMVFFLYLIFF